MPKKWKLVLTRLCHADPPETCQAPACPRMALYSAIKSAKDEKTIRTLRCRAHALAIADKAKISVEGLT